MKDKGIHIGDEILVIIFVNSVTTIGTLRSYRTLEQFAKGQAALINAGCGILEWLDLLESDSESVFGFRPTPRLIELLITRPLSKDSEKPWPGKPDPLEIAMEEVMSKMGVERQLAPFINDLMILLGLARRCEKDEVVSTKEFRRLIAEKRDMERLYYYDGWDDA